MNDAADMGDAFIGVILFVVLLIAGAAWLVKRPMESWTHDNPQLALGMVITLVTIVTFFVEFVVI